ncbi:hypothetical protein HDV00_010999 [Rhizophlyctis rosea]|nr:hypothetical protein HDV00_010999 [Rhizophlyctis rosea]
MALQFPPSTFVTPTLSTLLLHGAPSSNLALKEGKHSLQTVRLIYCKGTKDEEANIQFINTCRNLREFTNNQVMTEDVGRGYGVRGSCGCGQSRLVVQNNRDDWTRGGLSPSDLVADVMERRGIERCWADCGREEVELLEEELVWGAQLVGLKGVMGEVNVLFKQHDHM